MVQFAWKFLVDRGLTVNTIDGMQLRHSFFPPKRLDTWRPQQQAMTSCKRRLFVEADCENSLLLQNC